MKFTLEKAEGQAIRSYKPGELRIGSECHRSNMIVMQGFCTAWNAVDADTLSVDNLLPLLEFKPDIVILGTGEKQVFPPIESYAPLLQKGIGVEVMDSAAATRTYNLLLADGRRVLAALIV